MWPSSVLTSMPGRTGKLCRFGEGGDLGGVPEEVVLGEADGVEAGCLGGFDEFVGGEEAVVGEGVGVGVEVDEHRKLSAIRRSSFKLFAITT